MKHRKKLQDSDEGHIVLVYDKTRLVERRAYPTYGKASWGVLELEEKYPDFVVEYRDVRTFKVDTYE